MVHRLMSYLGIGVSLAIVLTHNKGNTGNAAQITFVQNRTQVLLFDTGQSDPENPGETIKISYRVISALARPHELLCLQIVPQGVLVPLAIDSLEPCIKVYYGPDQPSHTRRYFNWGLKRATDYGSEIVAFLEGTSTFTVDDLSGAFDLREPTWGRVLTKRVQERLGVDRKAVLREDLTFNQALTDLRQRIDAEGLSRG